MVTDSQLQKRRDVNIVFGRPTKNWSIEKLPSFGSVCMELVQDVSNKVTTHANDRVRVQGSDAILPLNATIYAMNTTKDILGMTPTKAPLGVPGLFSLCSYCVPFCPTLGD